MLYLSCVSSSIHSFRMYYERWFCFNFCFITPKNTRTALRPIWGFICWALAPFSLSQPPTEYRLNFGCFWFQSVAEKIRLIPGPGSGPGPGHGPALGHQDRNGYAGRIHLLPDLIQQSHHSPSPSITSTPSSSHTSPSMSPQSALERLLASEVCLAVVPLWTAG